MKTKKTDFNQVHSRIERLLTQSDKPLIISHIRPDGDAIGSIVGLSLALQKAGKKPQMVLASGLPKKFRFLTGAEQIAQRVKDNYDLVITLDCADEKRMGSFAEISRININIDHHITNELFAEINLVIPEQPATTAILAEYLPRWGFTIDKDVANALLMGMITDTIGFSTSNITPEFLRLAANLMEKGADLPSLYHQALSAKSLPASKIWGNALSRIEFEGNIAWTTITLEDRINAAYQGQDDADLTNYLSLLENIDITILFNEQRNDKVKVSWRSNVKYDVSKIAMQFGGGGHPPAAGAEITGNLEKVMDLVLGETKKFMQGNN
ncbi:MAG: bifunctional oligoribonuclease/PAP phosphatase NrnA [Anaerolineaceae bacterium]|nr:bifunctional oligoribonuclease/PAP phosphatase NrnA [Anaerolineaceae bacterium]